MWTETTEMPVYSSGACVPCVECVESAQGGAGAGCSTGLLYTKLAVGVRARVTVTVVSSSHDHDSCLSRLCNVHATRITVPSQTTVYSTVGYESTSEWLSTSSKVSGPSGLSGQRSAYCTVGAWRLAPAHLWILFAARRVVSLFIGIIEKPIDGDESSRNT